MIKTCLFSGNDSIDMPIIVVLADNDEGGGDATELANADSSVVVPKGTGCGIRVLVISSIKSGASSFLKRILLRVNSASVLSVRPDTNTCCERYG